MNNERKIFLQEFVSGLDAREIGMLIGICIQKLHNIDWDD